MDFELLISQEVNLTSEDQFWKAVEIWLNNPHLINRRISSSTSILKAELKSNSGEILDIISNCDVSQLSDSDTNKTVNSLNISDKVNRIFNDTNPFENENGVYIFVRKLFPRNENEFSPTFEFAILNYNTKCITCITKEFNCEKRSLGLSLPYQIIHHDGKVSMMVKNLEQHADNPSIFWLKEKFFPRLIKWIECQHNKTALIEGSLNLVSSEKYTNLYNILKKKYGIDLVKKWPECTDPAKFVYEDIAIATYLILLWEKERNDEGILKKQSFLDLGCGNGLLVYLLTKEGYPGQGIDLRKRKIWDSFSGVRLEERTIIPSSESLFPDTDWLIGNHSDELTPWIPVIAARSSYKCKFFLLPCCAHEFDGRKFQRCSAANSQFFEYLKYVKSICETCGFRTELDKLRIPSTKRICLIGGKRNYPEEQSLAKDKEIEAIIQARSIILKKSEEGKVQSSDNWLENFKPRDTVERVRNCTQIDKNIINEIVEIVSQELLIKVRMINIDQDTGKKWNAGGRIELSEIAKIVSPDLLKKLKKECGGLQTLLRNNFHIFQVVGGNVQLRIPGTEMMTKKKRRKSSNVLKVKPCWFFDNHPDGCPVSDEKCNFKHVQIKSVN